MALTPIEHELFKLQKFKKNQINHMQNGVRLAGLAGVPLEDLLRQASSARLKLAKRASSASSQHLMSHRPCSIQGMWSREPTILSTTQLGPYRF